ncbi:MAG: sensor histidine kinase [Thermoleophilia bacterium]
MTFPDAGLGVVRRARGVPWRERRFWMIQAIVLAITAGHVTLEVGGPLLGWPHLYLIPVTTFFAPALYASLAFGQRGAVPTVLWCWALSLPTIILVHTHTQQVGINLQLTIMLVMTVIVGRSVDAERQAAAETTAANARLRELNATALAASQSLDLDRVFTDTTRLIAGQPGTRMAWVVHAPDGWDSRVEVVSASSGATADGLPPAQLEAARSVIAAGAPLTPAVTAASAPESGGEHVVVPVLAEGRVTGALGIAGPAAAFAAVEAEQLLAIARQLGLAVANIRHLEEAHAALRDLAESQAALQKYVQIAADSEEEERRRLAREIHDETIHELLVVRAGLVRACSRDGKGGERLAATVASLDAIIAELRRLCWDLRPSVLDDLGLPQALDALVYDLGERSGICVSLTCEGTESRVDPRTELILYRIAQEALHNVEKHAAARHATVSLVFDRGAATLRVVDDGRGFGLGDEGARAAEAGRLGLLGMRERARSMGGSLIVATSPGAGTSIEVRAALA